MEEFNMSALMGLETKYKNVFNNVVIEGMDENEHRLLFVAIAKVNDMWEDETSVTSAELEELRRIGKLSKSDMENVINSFKYKLDNKTTVLTEEGDIVPETLFKTWRYDKANDELRVATHISSLYYFNMFDGLRGVFGL